MIPTMQPSRRPSRGWPCSRNRTDGCQPMASVRSSTSAIASVSILRTEEKYGSPGVLRTGTSSRTMSVISCSTKALLSVSFGSVDGLTRAGFGIVASPARKATASRKSSSRTCMTSERASLPPAMHPRQFQSRFLVLTPNRSRPPQTGHGPAHSTAVARLRRAPRVTAVARRSASRGALNEVGVDHVR